LTNVSQGKHLPPSWTTLYELTKLDDDTFERKLRDGTIHPGMRRKDVAHRERLQNALRDFFGTFGAAGCISVPFRSTNGDDCTAVVFQKPLVIKGFAGCGEAA
jgi:hypothetical protein